MNNTCPQCGAVYAVAEKDIGRRIACKKCGTALVVSDTGLKRDDSPALSPRNDDPVDDRGNRKRDRYADDDDDDRGRRRERRENGGSNIGNVFIKKLKQFADVATWVYGFGLILTIYAFFSPQIDRAKVEGREGDIQQAAAEDEADENYTNQSNDGKPNEDARKQRDKNRKEYQREKPKLEVRKKLAAASAQQSHWWTVMYRLIGFSLLALGSVAFLMGEQPNIKRILGAATIGLILLEIIGGAGFAFRVGGGPG